MESIRDQLEELPQPWGEDGDLEKFNEALESNHEVVSERNDEIGDGMKVGKVVSFSVADGKAWYEIVEIGEKISRVSYIPELCPDNYTARQVDSDGFILTSNLKEAVRWADSDF